MLNFSAEAVSKGEFAKMIGVSPGRITQMISEGKIGPDALEGEGRMAKIIPEIAKAQISARTDIGQSMGNGSNTRVRDEMPVSSAMRDTGSSLDADIRRERLAQMQRQNRIAAEKELAARGTYMRSDDARLAMTKMAAQMLSLCEGAMVDLATAVSAKFGLTHRDVVHLLRAEFRTIRGNMAQAVKTQAESLPELDEDFVADASDEAAGEA